MADFTIKNPPEYDPALRMLEPTDPNHADVFNQLYGQLINNEAFLAELARRTAHALAEHLGSDAVHVTEQDKQEWNAKAGTAAATQADAGLMAAADKTKLDGVAAGAEVNQNAYSSVKVGNVTVAANGKTAAFTLEAGNNITLSADNAAKKIIIAANRDGGNADTLDGYHASSFAAAGHGHVEVDELKKFVSDGKTSVAAAVTAKGVITAANATFATIAANIAKISSDATATDGEVLSGKTFYAKGQKITGKMTNRGAVTQALNAGGSYTIPAGYHNGSGKVTANSLASQTGGTVEVISHPYTGAAGYSQEIMKNKTAWVNGEKVTGLIQDESSELGLTAHPAWTEGNNLGALWTAPDKYYARVKGSTTRFKISDVPAAIGLTADKIVQGHTILGVAGTGGGDGKMISGSDIKLITGAGIAGTAIHLNDYVYNWGTVKKAIIIETLTKAPETGVLWIDFTVLTIESYTNNLGQELFRICGMSNRPYANGYPLSYNLQNRVGNNGSLHDAMKSMKYIGYNDGVHGGNVFDVTGNIRISGYVPGNTLTITCTIYII